MTIFKSFFSSTRCSCGLAGPWIAPVFERSLATHVNAANYIDNARMQAMHEADHFYHAVVHITNFTTPIARNAFYMTGKIHTNDMNLRPSLKTVCSNLINGQDWHFWVFHNVHFCGETVQGKYWPLIAPPFRVGWACGNDDRS